MRYVRRAPQGSFGSRKKSLYARRKEVGVCTCCGANPVVVLFPTGREAYGNSVRSRLHAAYAMTFEHDDWEMQTLPT